MDLCPLTRRARARRPKSKLRLSRPPASGARLENSGSMLFAPPFGEVMQGLEAFHQLLAQWRQAIAVAGQEFDEAGLAQLRKPGLHHRRRGVVAGGAERTRGQR